VFRDAPAARWAIERLTDHRERPFHWQRERTTRREEAVTLLENHAAATYLLAQPTTNRYRVEARRELLAYLVAELLSDGVDHVIIESSQVQATDDRDRDTILDSFRANSANRTFTYDWRT